MVWSKCVAHLSLLFWWIMVCLFFLLFFTVIIYFFLDHFRDIISEVGAIRGFLGIFMKDISREVEKLLHCLQELGLLHTL